MQVAIRVDSSRLIGSGHIMRCLTLADQLRKAGCNVLFLCRDLPGHCYKNIKQRHHQYYLLPFESSCHYETLLPNDDYRTWLGVPLQQDAEETISFIKKNPVDLLIIDVYALDIRWQKRVRPYVSKLMVIDDLANRKHDCDIILDHNFYLQSKTRYNDLVPTYCKKLLGPDYALISDAFFEIGEKRKLMSSSNPFSLNKILVFLGGMDIKNYSQLVLEGLLASSLKNCHIDIVLGATNPHALLLQKRYESYNNIFFHIQPDYYLRLMEQTDLAIGAGGVSALERLIAHVPSILIKTAENQEQICHDMSAAGLVIYAPDGIPLASVFNKLSISDLNQLIGNNTYSAQPNNLLIKELMRECAHS